MRDLDKREVKVIDPIHFLGRDNCGLLYCVKCRISIRNKSKGYMHWYSEHKEFPFNCSICKYHSVREAKMIDHMMKNHHLKRSEATSKMIRKDVK